MMNVKRHCKQRYIERIVEVKDKLEQAQYLTLNDQKIVDDLNKMYENSIFIYKGQIGDNITRNFYIRDNNVIVTDSQDTCLITIYKVDFGFGAEIDRGVIKGLIEKLDDLYSELRDVEEFISQDIERLKIESENTDVAIKSLESQIAILKQKKQSIDSDIKQKRSNTEFVRKDIDKTAFMLCNSIDYKKDLQEMTK